MSNYSISNSDSDKMSSSIGSDQRCLITDEHDNPPTYQDVTNQSKK